MAHPKRRSSKARKGKRRAHQALRVPSLAPCPRCSHLKPPHRVCPQCGEYKGVEKLPPNPEFE